MIRPGVQKPHCTAPCSMNAACSGCSSSPCASPSIVVTAASLRLERRDRCTNRPACRPPAPCRCRTRLPRSRSWCRSGRGHSAARRASVRNSGTSSMREFVRSRSVSMLSSMSSRLYSRHSTLPQHLRESLRRSGRALHGQRQHAPQQHVDHFLAIFGGGAVSTGARVQRVVRQPQPRVQRVSSFAGWPISAASTASARAGTCATGPIQTRTSS